MNLRRHILSAFAVIALVALPDGSAARAEGPSADLVAGWIRQLETEAALVSQEMQAPVTMVASGGTLSLGSAGPRVEQLTARLNELGVLSAEQHGTLFTAEIDAAVRVYQAREGLLVDGQVGPQTRAALNRTRADTLLALRWSIDRMGELLSLVPDTFLLVNVPSTRAMLIRNGTVAMDMAAAVGRPSRRTPLLTDRIVNVTLNPTWSVPPTIMREDVLPRLRRSGTTGITNATVYLSGEQVDPGAVDWSAVSPWQIWIRQSPGNHNALGRFLFALTNDQNIFIHDTNQHSIFERANREISSGCVRIEGARQLAEFLLAENGTDLSVIDRGLASRATRVLPLDRPLPVFMTYWTATPQAGGHAAIHRDIYNMTIGYRPREPLLTSDSGPVTAVLPPDT